MVVVYSQITRLTGVCEGLSSVFGGLFHIASVFRSAGMTMVPVPGQLVPRVTCHPWCRVRHCTQYFLSATDQTANDTCAPIAGLMPPPPPPTQGRKLVDRKSSSSVKCWCKNAKFGTLIELYKRHKMVCVLLCRGAQYTRYTRASNFHSFTKLHLLSDL